ncbi:hypothetical protein SLS57_002381 [Botryosphaeria dothidea]
MSTTTSSLKLIFIINRKLIVILRKLHNRGRLNVINYWYNEHFNAHSATPDLPRQCWTDHYPNNDNDPNHGYHSYDSYHPKYCYHAHYGNDSHDGHHTNNDCYDCYYFNNYHNAYDGDHPKYCHHTNNSNDSHNSYHTNNGNDPHNFHDFNDYSHHIIVFWAWNQLKQLDSLIFDFDSKPDLQLPG